MMLCAGVCLSHGTMHFRASAYVKWWQVVAQGVIVALRQHLCKRWNDDALHHRWQMMLSASAYLNGGMMLL